MNEPPRSAPGRPKHAKADSASLETLCVADQVCGGVYGVVDLSLGHFSADTPLLRQILSRASCNMTRRLAQAATGLLLRDEQTLLIAYAEQAGGSVDTALLPARRQRPVCLRGPSEGWERAYAPGAPPEQRGSLPCGLRSAPHAASKMKRAHLPAPRSASRASPHCRSRRRSPTSPWTETRDEARARRTSSECTRREHQAQHQEQQRSAAAAAAAGGAGGGGGPAGAAASGAVRLGGQ